MDTITIRLPDPTQYNAAQTALDWGVESLRDSAWQEAYARRAYDEDAPAREAALATYCDLLTEGCDWQALSHALCAAFVLDCLNAIYPHENTPATQARLRDLAATCWHVPADSDDLVLTLPHPDSDDSPIMHRMLWDCLTDDARDRVAAALVATTIAPYPYDDPRELLADDDPEHHLLQSTLNDAIVAWISGQSDYSPDLCDLIQEANLDPDALATAWDALCGYGEDDE